MSSPLDGTLAPPWVLRRTSPVLGGEADSRQSLRSTCLPTVSPADLHSELGPRSLDTDRPFWGALPSLFEARCRLQTSATEHDVRTNQPGLLILAGREAVTSILFSTCHALSLAEAVTRGEPRCVRSCQPQCWFVPLAQACPTVMPTGSPHLRDLRRGA
jgi:hypothetical protein